MYFKNGQIEVFWKACFFSLSPKSRSVHLWENKRKTHEVYFPRIGIKITQFLKPKTAFQKSNLNFIVFEYSPYVFFFFFSPLFLELNMQNLRILNSI